MTKISFQSGFVALLYWGLRMAMVLAFIFFLVKGEMRSAVITLAIFMIMMIPAVFNRRLKLSLPFELEAAIVWFVFLALFLGTFQKFYHRFIWWDTMLHFVSGILLGVLGFVLVYLLNKNDEKSLKMTHFFVSIFSFSFSMTMGVVWEIYEYLGDYYFDRGMQPGLSDTMGDLIVAAVGSAIVALVAYFWMKNRERLPFTPATIESQ